MKTILIAALVAVAAFPIASADDSVTVHLAVNAGHASLPVWRSCDVTVSAGSNVGAVLDQAVADGCILEWSHASFEGFGRYVTSIDHVTEAVATFWAFRVDGAFATTGIDSTTVASGASYQFTYEEWPAPLPL